MGWCCSWKHVRLIHSLIATITEPLTYNILRFRLSLIKAATVAIIASTLELWESTVVVWHLWRTLGQRIYDTLIVAGKSTYYLATCFCDERRFLQQSTSRESWTCCATGFIFCCYCCSCWSNSSRGSCREVCECAQLSCVPKRIRNDPWFRSIVCEWIRCERIQRWQCFSGVSS